MAVASDDDRRFEVLRTVTRRAGSFILERFGHADVAFKPDDSMLTDVDGAVQAALTRQLAEAFPSDAALGEEGLDPQAGRPHSEYVWVIDPIDGTNNFGRGMPGFSVSVGVLRDGLVVGGAVYDPLARQLFSAWRDRGAWLDDRRLRLTSVPLDGRSMFSIRTPFSGGVPKPVERWLSLYRLRRVGSTALQLCYVALGAIAFMFDHRASLWDIAGATAVIAEAGGHVTAPDGAPLFPPRDQVWSGAPMAVLAGVPGAYENALRDLAATGALAR
jgi:myo-inositol-1(or 4)-monophosphatase